MNNRLNFKKYWDSLVSFLINHIVWTILYWLGGLILLNIPYILKKIYLINNKLTAYSGLFSTISILITLILMVIFIFRFKNKTRSTQAGTVVGNMKSQPEMEDVQKKNESEDGKNSLNDNLIDGIKFDEFRVELYFKSRTEIIYKLYMSGTVNCDSIEYFSKELTWSGSKYIRTEVYKSNVGNSIEDNVEKRTSSPYKYTLPFDNTKYRGEEVLMGFKTLVLDEEERMLPFSLFHIKYPIEKLTMVLSVDNSVKVRNVRKTGYNDMSRESRYFAPNGLPGEDFGDLVKYSYTINQPTAWKYYAIEWDF